MSWRMIPRIVVGIVAVVASVGFLCRTYSEWETVYIPAAARLWNGEPLYRDVENYLYPPLASFLAIPWLFLTPLAGRVAWYAVNATAIWTILRTGWSLADGTTNNDHESRGWTSWVAGLACGGVFLQNSWSHQQTDLVIAALQVAGILMMVRGRDYATGACFGLAAALKCTPLLWLPYLIYRGRFIASGMMVTVVVAVSLLPDAVNQPPSGTWISRYSVLLSGHGGTAHMGIWGTDPLYNQSLAGASLRLLAVEGQKDEKGLHGVFHPERISPESQQRIVMALVALLLLTTLVCAGRPGWVAGAALPWEGSIVLLLALLMSPMSGPAHFGVMVIPGFLLARRAQDDWSCAGFVAVTVLLGLMNAKDLVGPIAYSYALLYSTVTLASLVLLIGCWRELARLRWSRPELIATLPLSRAA